MDWDTPPRRGPGMGNGQQDLEEILRKLRGRFDFSGFKKGPAWTIGVLFLVALALLSCFYTIEPQETGVVLRFGQYVRITGPGWNFKLPFGVETVRKITGRVLQREYGYRTVQPGVRSRFTEKGYEEEARMLSGDLNVVDLQWTVQYNIQDPVAYLFQVHDVEATMDDISESVVRRIVGNRYADDVLTVGRADIADKARIEIQQILDQYKTGLKISTVKLQNANPPDPVKAAFNEVNEARQEKERMINESQQAYNQKIPKAMGEARQVITQAEGYALERVNKAQGEVHRFSDIQSEYEKAPDVTRRRMYLEAVGDFIGHMEQVFILDEKQQNILPLFDINKRPESRRARDERGGESAPAQTSRPGAKENG